MGNWAHVLYMGGQEWWTGMFELVASVSRWGLRFGELEFVIWDAFEIRM